MNPDLVVAIILFIPAVAFALMMVAVVALERKPIEYRASDIEQVLRQSERRPDLWDLAMEYEL